MEMIKERKDKRGTYPNRWREENGNTHTNKDKDKDKDKNKHVNTNKPDKTHQCCL